MARKKRKSYRRRRGIGLAGLSGSKFNMKNATDGAINIAATAAGIFAAAKCAGFLDKMINKSGSKGMGFVSPSVVTIVGIAGTIVGDGFLKSAAQGIAVGGLLKVAEKAMNKENLLSGTDDQPLMLPGVGDIGFANLPELSHYSENPEADVTTTGGDPQYRMGQPSELLSGDEDEIIAY